MGGWMDGWMDGWDGMGWDGIGLDWVGLAVLMTPDVKALPFFDMSVSICL